MAGNITAVNNIFTKPLSYGAAGTPAQKSGESATPSFEMPYAQPAWLKEFKAAFAGTPQTKPATGTQEVKPAAQPQEVTRVAGPDAHIDAQTSSVARNGMRAYDTNYWVNEVMPQMTSKPGGGYDIAGERIRYLG